eukprot:CAMPEP_0170593558 /NCGR_PEP_ID=MMETSP0224-20130122/13517_1 /TAXON_ID=285029 /ORGANISM="Togula jolla, Strain CCCM 725" /LENGTH=209 /DNA_ID=CAMNT_0010917529 /DNA_START=417 /DNA_END=1047 /DNA_ORIENTATION=-
MCQSSRLESAGRASVGSAGALPVLQLLAQAGHVVRCAAAHRDHVQPVGEADWASIPSGPVLDQVLQRQVSRVGHQEVSSLHLVAGCHSRLLALHCLAGAHFSSSVKAAKVARTLPATAAAGRGAPVHVIHCALIRRDLGAPRRLEEFAAFDISDDSPGEKVMPEYSPLRAGDGVWLIAAKAGDGMPVSTLPAQELICMAAPEGTPNAGA